MRNNSAIVYRLGILVITVGSLLPGWVPRSEAQAQEATPSSLTRRIGSIKATNGNVLTLSPDSGADVSVTIQPNARLLRIAPGEKDLKNATPVQLQDLQVGDRVRVRGQASGDAISAVEIIVMARTDLEARHEQEKQDWQRRGIGGLVDSVDAAPGGIKLSIPSLFNKRTILIQTTQNTVVRRYSPESARPEDAKVGTLADIHVGDQLRVRGNRSADGAQITAEEIYAGLFPQILGTIKSLDAGAGTLEIQDLTTKKMMQLKIAPDSQLHKIPPEMAQRLAGMVKAAKAGGIPGVPGSAPGSASGQVAAKNPAEMNGGQRPATGPGGAGGMAGGFRRNGAGMDSQRMLDQTPAITLADLHKGDAVAVLATEGTSSAGSTVVKLFSGVEPVLEASPSASQAMMLTPWSLGGAPTGESQ